ncbi:sulfite exporter TauE/SafE family protein [Alcaligenaceae bacterium]|nr:sulfite exporter TauE/SafE family protein [Alcaligenaceae bacterium]
MDPIFIISLMSLGLAVGFLAGLLGIGGGMILVPFLAMLFPIYGVEPDLVIHASIATAMATIIFTSVSSVRAHHAKKAILWKVVAVMAPGLMIGGLLSGGALFSYLSGAWLAVFFAVFIGYSAVRMLLAKPPVATRTMPGKVVTAAVGAGIGFVSGLLGAGGAFLSVPFMTRSNVSVRNAVATSAAIGFFIAVANSVGYIYSGFQHVQGQDGMLGYIYWPALLVVSSMSMFSAPFGARMAHQISTASLKRIFACLLFGLSTYMMYKAWHSF